MKGRAMFARLSILCCLCVLFYVPAVKAEQAQGHIGAAIIDLQQMTTEDLQKFCEEEPQTVACQIYQEQVVDEEKENLQVYEVLTGNLQ